MDTILVQKLLATSLTEEERTIGHLQESDIAVGISECRASFYARILTETNGAVNLKGFLAVMSRAWGCQSLRLVRVGHNMVQAFFPSVKEATRVHRSGPWCYDNNLIVTRLWERGMTPTEDLFSECSFWVQIHQLPAEFLTVAVATTVKSLFPGCEGIELREDSDMNRFFRLKAPVSLRAPLRRVVQLQLDGVVVPGVLAYERIPHHCNFCGVLGHQLRSCPGPGTLEEKRKNVRYGMWGKTVAVSTKISFKSATDQDGFVIKTDAGHTPGRGMETPIVVEESLVTPKGVDSETPLSEASLNILVELSDKVPSKDSTISEKILGKRLAFRPPVSESPAMVESLAIFKVTSGDDLIEVPDGGGDMGTSSSPPQPFKGKARFPLLPSPPSASLPKSGKPPTGKKRRLLDDMATVSCPSLSASGLEGAGSDFVSAEAVVQPRRSP